MISIKHKMVFHGIVFKGIIGASFVVGIILLYLVCQLLTPFLLLLSFNGLDFSCRSFLTFYWMNPSMPFHLLQPKQ